MRPLRPGSPPTHAFTAQIVVKLRDWTDIPPGQTPADYLRGLVKVLDAEVRGLGNAEVVPLLTYWSPADLEQRTAEAQKRDPNYTGPKLTYYLAVGLPPGVDRELAKASLKSLEQVERAYFNVPGENPEVKPSSDPKARQQGYLESAPAGIGVRDVWPSQRGDGIRGSGGDGVAFVDMELGWTLDHVDLVDQKAQRVYGAIDDPSRDHGTSVLGVVAAVDNRRGCIGIVPRVAKIRVVSYAANLFQDRVNAMAAAFDELKAGDVLLIEAQTSQGGLPIEALEDEFESIRLAIAKGIVVVAAAGNGGRDLDAYRDPDTGAAVFNRAVRDSGAILVAAASSTVPHTPLPLSNRGSRIDCYAWGENVVTLSSDATGATTIYRGDFGGTSAAAAIIAGAAVSVQGMALAQLKRRLDPLEMRRLLSDATTGTPSAGATAAVPDRIGVMPDLAALGKSPTFKP